MSTIKSTTPDAYSKSPWIIDWDEVGPEGVLFVCFDEDGWGVRDILGNRIDACRTFEELAALARLLGINYTPVWGGGLEL